jgi:hypothetical protein
MDYGVPGAAKNTGDDAYASRGSPERITSRWLSRAEQVGLALPHQFKKWLRRRHFRCTIRFAFTFDSSRHLKLDSNFLPMIALRDTQGRAQNAAGESENVGR